MKKADKQRNIFLELEYLGTNYFGFQIQNKKSVKEATVQGVLQKVIKKIFKEDIVIVYSSRTDRGVHARAQAVNFTTFNSIPLKKIKRTLNSLLPADIRVTKVKKVPLEFHSRFGARSKIYRYLIFRGKEPSVFIKDFSWYIKNAVDIEKIRKAAKKLIGKKDFSLFAKEAEKYNSCIRNLMKIEVKKKGRYIYIDLEASGYLRNMARNIVSFLVKVGQGNILSKDISKILKKDISYNNFPAPAQGLYLFKVNY